MAEQRDLVIIGGGMGGYAAALRAAQLKKKVTLVEEDRIGGTCMNYGCIPTKFLLHETDFWREVKEYSRFEGMSEHVCLNWPLVQAEKRNIIDRLVRGIEFLLQRSRVEVLKGRGFLKENKSVLIQTASGDRILQAPDILLAMGSRAAALPFLEPDGRTIITHLEALDLEEIPKTMIVVGAGAIGLEIGTIFVRMGTDVTVVEIMPAILPGMDKPMTARLERLLRKQGLKISTEMRIEESVVEGEQVRLKGTCLKTGASFEFKAARILLAAGRKPNSEVLLPDYADLLDARGFVRVNAHLETKRPGIWAIGDLIGGKLLAHKAEHEGITAAENIAGDRREMDYRALPMSIFTDPELASVGLSDEEAREKGIQPRVGLFSLQANGRALTLGRPDGLVKIIAAPDGRVIGAHILAPNASELIVELALAVQKGLTLQDLSSTIHIHPTLSEATMEAALKAQGMAIHALNE